MSNAERRRNTPVKGYRDKPEMKEEHQMYIVDKEALEEFLRDMGIVAEIEVTEDGYTEITTRGSTYLITVEKY